MAPPQPSVTGRAVLALGLAVVFYALTVAVAVLLTRIAYAGISGETRIPRTVIATCVVGAILLVYASLPRRERFAPPGPELRRADQPQIWAIIDRLTLETGQPVPVTAYWCPEPNAFVRLVGGFLGLGGRRVLGLGFPLAVALDADALRAVIAHEYGHFHAGDVRFGPLVSVTHSAVARATRSMRTAADALPLLFVLRLPFLGFAAIFLRLTSAVSRRQELVADGLAARLVSPEAVGRALSEISKFDRAWSEYLDADVAPLLASKLRPPIASGWQAYLNSPEVLDELARKADRKDARPVRNSPSAEPYDSHPSQADRLHALGLDGGATRGSMAPTGPLLAVVVEGVDAVELDLLEVMTEDPLVRGFRTIGWDRVVPELLEPRWRESLTRYAAGIRGLSPERFPTRAEDLTELGRKLNPRDAKDPVGAQRRAVSVLTAALAISLRRRGFTLDSRPGAPLRAQQGEETVDVEDAVRGVAAGRITSVAWADRCRALGIEGVDLGAEAAEYLR